MQNILEKKQNNLNNVYIEMQPLNYNNESNLDMLDAPEANASRNSRSYTDNHLDKVTIAKNALIKSADLPSNLIESSYVEERTKHSSYLQCIASNHNRLVDIIYLVTSFWVILSCGLLSIFLWFNVVSNVQGIPYVVIYYLVCIISIFCLRSFAKNENIKCQVIGMIGAFILLLVIILAECVLPFFEIGVFWALSRLFYGSNVLNN